jgi:hypothetical protein
MAMLMPRVIFFIVGPKFKYRITTVWLAFLYLR